MKPIQLNEIGLGPDKEGGLESIYEKLLIQCVNDLRDPDKDPAKKRQIVITLDIEGLPSGIKISYNAKAKVPDKLATSVFIDSDTLREIKFCNEIPGQLNIEDTEFAERLRHNDDGEIVEE